MLMRSTVFSSPLDRLIVNALAQQGQRIRVRLLFIV